MALILVKKGTTDEFSIGTEADALINSVLLDGSGGTVTSIAINAELYATDKEYESIALSIVLEQAEQDYQLSLNGTNWFDSLSVPNMDASSAPVRTDIYVRVVVVNDETFSAAWYRTPNLRVQANGIQNP